MTRISEIFEIPERVHQGDFVLKLTEGVDRAEETLRSYVVTPQLVRSFDQALSLIHSAVAADTSKGAYLHGSFGSGKSHFMAVLSLLLSGHAAARAIPPSWPAWSRATTAGPRAGGSWWSPTTDRRDESGVGRPRPVRGSRAPAASGGAHAGLLPCEAAVR